MSLAIGHLIDELKERYAGLVNVLGFLNEVLADIVEYGEGLREQHGNSEGFELSGDGLAVQRYQANLLVDHGGSHSAPIIVEDNPTFPKLLGRVDHLAHMGTLVTNFTLIKAGALHRANGGFLMLDADKILRQLFAWEALKRTLKAGEIRMESLEQTLGFGSGLPLAPAPIKLSCKLVLFGEPVLYYLLKEYDPEFSELFHVAADFETDVERSDENTRRFARRIADLCRRDGVRPFERETEMGGPIHSKGVMILSSFLATRYSSQIPLSLAASLVFEQSYGPVEGDSASLAELCALLSALSGAPIDQSLAVTGSVNQFGMVQAIGAVNEKIEGFFDICRLRGLTGRQGVLIPEGNLKNLMLRQDVVAAVADGQFRIHAVASVEQAIELLTGIAAGEPDDEGVAPEGSINYLVAARMIEMSQVRQSFAGGDKRRRRSRAERSNNHG